MDSGLDLRPLVVGYALALCRTIAGCADLQSVVRRLEQAASSLLNTTDALDQPGADTEAADEELRSCRRALLAGVAAAAAAPGQHRQLLRQLFYTSSAFRDLSETLLTGGCDIGAMLEQL